MSQPRARFAARLADRPLLADGGMGTLLFSRGIPQRACLDELAATRPDLVGTIHREYLDAGADLIETLTFGANRIRLDAFGLAAEAGRLNRRAAQVAREARDVSGRDAWVGGSIGPLGPAHPRAAPPGRRHDPRGLPRADRRPPRGRRRPPGHRDVLRPPPPAARRRRGPARGRRAGDRVDDVRRGPGARRRHDPGRGPRGARRTPASTPSASTAASGPLACLDALGQLGPAGDGRAGPVHDAQRRPAAAPRGPLRLRGGARLLRLHRAPAARRRGAVIGGCCGTTPDHIAAMRAALDGHHHRGPAPFAGPRRRPRPPQPGRRARAPARPSRRPTRPDATPSARSPAGDPPRAAPSPSGRFVISVEIDPPRSIRIDRTLEAARLLRDAGADVVNISDSAMARVRMGAMAVAFGVQHDLDRRVRRPHHDPRPEPDGARVGAAGRPRPGRAQHPGAHRGPAARRRLPHRHRRLGRGLDRPDRDPRPAQPRRGPGGLADRPPGRRSPSPAPSTPPPTTPRPSGTAWSASSPPAPTWS